MQAFSAYFTVQKINLTSLFYKEMIELLIPSEIILCSGDIASFKLTGKTGPYLGTVFQ